MLTFTLLSNNLMISCAVIFPLKNGEIIVTDFLAFLKLSFILAPAPFPIKISHDTLLSNLFSITTSFFF